MMDRAVVVLLVKLNWVVDVFQATCTAARFAFCIMFPNIWVATATASQDVLHALAERHQPGFI